MYTNRDVVLRCIIAAFIKELSERLSFFNVHSEINIDRIPVPVFYGQMGQELPYIEDYFDQSEGDCVDGAQNLPIPRGMLTVDGISINQAEETGWAQVEIPVALDGNVVSLRANCKMVPIKLSTKVNILCSNHIELLKVIESIMARIWSRSNMFRVNCMGFPIEATFAPDSTYNRKFPIDISKDTTDREYSIELNLELASVVPIFEYGVSLSEVYYHLSRLLKDEDRKKKLLEHPVLTLTRTNDGSLGYECCGIIEKFIVNLYESDELLRQYTIPDKK